MHGATENQTDFQRIQRDFAAHLRHPREHAPPAEIEDRRLAIYRDLIYNNIESFIASGFPVLRKLYSDSDWHAMVRDFVHLHASRSPYFLQISEEFLHYLQNEREAHPCDPPFLLELAHYEWVELALDVSDAEIPGGLSREGDVLASIPVVSPLVWSLSYRFPVHQIGPAFQPEEPPEAPTFLLVYRDRSEEVGFMETNAVTARLLQLAQAEALPGRDLLLALAEEMHHPEPEVLVQFGQDLLEKLLRAGIVAGLR
ncbi:hypothetical protein AUP74_00112 [Microbulbifer aggregans]|uniref:Uncharacterized protein n=1 Tax=Microbulbifer aggregans TaxID=1769779 RepID=A0A1C9W359_9GAMM|nr:putative DNA-binding domain-containing protein [Microbulbifer aggregans]AOS95588.1 hypothetical protein AUP74_00112 [Microbulbifer aggregans]